MKKSKTVRLTDEELEIIQAIRKGKLEPTADTVTESTPVGITDGQQALADAFVSAIERTRPPEKKTVFNRKKRTPWTPPEGTPDVKLKRHMYQHGIEISPTRVTVDVKELLNKVKPGRYLEGFVVVTLRKDRGIDISYPVKTASQRLRLVNQFGIRSFKELLERIIDEKENPAKYRKPDDADLYE